MMVRQRRPDVSPWWLPSHASPCSARFDQNGVVTGTRWRLKSTFLEATESCDSCPPDSPRAVSDPGVCTSGARRSELLGDESTFDDAAVSNTCLACKHGSAETRGFEARARLASPVLDSREGSAGDPATGALFEHGVKMGTFSSHLLRVHEAVSTPGSFPDHDENSSAMSDYLRLLEEENVRCVLMVRRISRLGFQSDDILATHNSRFGQVKRVLVPRSKVKSQFSRRREIAFRIRPGSLGFIAMEESLNVDRILRAGRDQIAAGLSIVVEPFQPTGPASNRSSAIIVG